MEGQLGGFECAAGSRQRLRGPNKVAAAISGPNRILIGACDFPRYLIASRRLLHANRRPATKLSSNDVRATIFQRRTSSRTDAIKEELGFYLNQAGRPIRFNNGTGHADHAIIIQVLMEGQLGGFECAAGSRQRLRGPNKVAAAISGPNRILIGACNFPRYLIASRRLLHANRRPATKLSSNDVRATIFQR